MLACIALYYSFLPIGHTDIWAHAAFGEWILEYQELPLHEPFISTADHSVTVPTTQWLSQVLYGTLLRAGKLGAGQNDPQCAIERGTELLRSLHWFAMIGLFICLWLAYRRVSASAHSANLALLIVFLAINAGIAVQRPQSFAALCFALLLLILSRVRRKNPAENGKLEERVFTLPRALRGEGRVGGITGHSDALAEGQAPPPPPCPPPQSRGRVRDRCGLLALPLLFCLWANLHGSFVVGLAFFFLTIVRQILRPNQPETPANFSAASKALADLGEPGASATGECAVKSGADVSPVTCAPGSPKQLLIIFSLCCAATLLNPAGSRLIVEVMTFAQRPNIHLLDEWQPLAFDTTTGGHRLFLASWAIVLLFWIFSGYQKTPMLLSVLPFGLWPLVQERSMIWWMMVCAWLIAALAPAVAARLSFFKHIPSSVPSLRKTFLAVAIALLTLLWSPPVQWLFKKSPPPLDQSLSLGTPWQLGLELQATPENQGRWLPNIREVLAFTPGNASKEISFPVKLKATTY